MADLYNLYNSFDIVYHDISSVSDLQIVSICFKDRVQITYVNPTFTEVN
jgi:hypothetical protein